MRSLRDRRCRYCQRFRILSLDVQVLRRDPSLQGRSVPVLLFCAGCNFPFREKRYFSFKWNGRTREIEQANAEKLKEISPAEVFADGKADDKLQGLSGRYIAVIRNEISFENQNGRRTFGDQKQISRRKESRFEKCPLRLFLDQFVRGSDFLPRSHFA